MSARADTQTHGIHSYKMKKRTRRRKKRKGETSAETKYVKDN